MNEKLIDKVRKSGGRMEIGTPDDQSQITALMSVGGTLYAIKEKGIYAIKLADEIDPARTNPDIPSVQQRIIALGSDSPLVGQTVLTAKELFVDEVLPKWFDCARAMLCALDALKDLAAICELKDAFIDAEERAIVAFETPSEAKGALILPAVGNVDTLCKTFFQKADHVSRSMLDIVKLFYKKLHRIKGIADLIQHAKERYGDTDPLVTYLKGVAPMLKYVRDSRNRLEHPNPPAMHANISDFALRPDGMILRPCIEVISGHDHYPKRDISGVMSELAEVLPQIFEGVVVSLCAKHAGPVGGLRPFLIRVEPEHRGRGMKYVQFSYGVKIGDEIVRLG